MKTRKITSLLLTVLFVMTMLVVPAYAADYTVKVEVDKEIVQINDELTVNIKLTTLPVGGYSFVVNFPVANLEFVSATWADGVAGSFAAIDQNSVAEGKVGYSDGMFGSKQFAGNVVATVKLKAKAVVEDAAITITESAQGWADTSFDTISFSSIETVGATVDVKPVHTAPTFDVAVSGTATSGQTLEAVVSNFADNWGLTPTYSYEWLADGVAISGAANASTYTLTANEYGKAISAKVTATVASADANTNTTTVTSAATAAVAVPATAPVLDVVTSRNDTVAVGTTISANASATIGALVGGTNTITYSWKVDGTQVGTGASYTIATTDYVDGDEVLTCDVTVTNDRNSLTDTATITFTNNIVAGNMPPVVSNTALSNVTDNKAVVGATVVASYTFTDVADASNTPADLDGGVDVEWYIVEEDGSKEVIATGESLAITKDMIGETISVDFAPWSNDATENTILGYEEEELLNGDVVTLSFTVEPDLTTAPVVSNVMINGGNVFVNRAFTVSYNYTDINGYAPNCSIALYKKADDSAVATASYTVSGNTVTITDDTLVGVEIYVKVTPANTAGYNPAPLAVDSAAATVAATPTSGGGGGLTGPVLGGGGSATTAPTTAPTTEPTTEPTTTPDASEAPVPAAKDCISLVIDNKEINAYGEAYTSDVAPFIVDGRTVLPVRAVAELLGAEVSWDEATRTVTLDFGERVVTLVIGEATATINGEAVVLNVAPFISEDRTFLGLRDMAEAIDMNVDWHETVRTVSITAKAE